MRRDVRFIAPHGITIKGVHQYTAVIDGVREYDTDFSRLQARFEAARQLANVKRCNEQNCETIRQLEVEKRLLLDTLKSLRQNIDVSTIGRSARVLNRWETLAARADQVIAQVDP